MRRIIFVVMITVLALCFFSCGNSDSKKDVKPQEYEIAMIMDGNDVNDGSFYETVWTAIKRFADEKGLSSKYYKSKEESREAYLDAIKKAVDNKAQIVVMPGSNFETAAFNAQTLYPEVKFVLIDGMPHDPDEKYGTASNTIGIIFAEEEAGFLAGYAAVKDGYKKLGFIGGKEVPPVKRYGYGFIQGAAVAAEEQKSKVSIRYMYSGTFEKDEKTEEAAKNWYEDGTEVIFACGGATGLSVIDAAEKDGGKVIGVDVDQSGLSNTVITSAKKNLDTVINDMLRNYINDKFIGGTAFNYTAENKGISLEIDNGKFNRFTEKDYNKIFKTLKEKKIQIKKDTGVGSITELTGKWVVIEQ